MSIKYTSFDSLPLALSVADVAGVLGVSKGLVYEMVARGELPSIRVGRQIRIPKSSLLKYMEASGS